MGACPGCPECRAAARPARRAPDVGRRKVLRFFGGMGALVAAGWVLEHVDVDVGEAVKAGLDGLEPPAEAAPAAPAPKPEPPLAPAPGQVRVGARDLAGNPAISATTDRGCDPAPDLAGGQLDERLQTVLALATEAGYTLRVSCAKTGHSRKVKGTNRTSNHWVWRAVDLDVVNGEPVNNRSRAARAFAVWLGELPEELRPSEIGSPFPDLSGATRYFHDSGHTGHVHVGWSGS